MEFCHPVWLALINNPKNRFVSQPSNHYRNTARCVILYTITPFTITVPYFFSPLLMRLEEHKWAAGLWSCLTTTCIAFSAMALVKIRESPAATWVFLSHLQNPRGPTSESHEPSQQLELHSANPPGLFSCQFANPTGRTHCFAVLVLDPFKRLLIGPYSLHARTDSILGDIPEQTSPVGAQEQARPRLLA